MGALTRVVWNARVVIMGPAGAGKSTVGPLVASRLGLTFLDADDYHDAAEHRRRMRSGAGLDDTQRIPWLRRLNHELRARQDAGTLLACSALRPEYRVILGEGIDHTIFVYLSVHEGTLKARLGARTDHFAGPALLPSQLRILDLGDDTITVDGEQPPAAVADAVVAHPDLAATRGGLTASSVLLEELPELLDHVVDAVVVEGVAHRQDHPTGHHEVGVGHAALGGAR